MSNIFMAKRLFSCVKCGQPFEDNPPDEFHLKSSVVDAYRSKIGINYRCVKCDMINTIYWGRY